MSALHVQIGAHGIIELLWQNLLFSFLSSEFVTKVSRFVVPHISEIVLPSPSGSSSPQRVAAADKQGASYRSL